MNIILSVLFVISLLNFFGLILLFRSLVVTNVKIEEEAKYKETINKNLNELGEKAEKQERLTSTSIGILNKIVELL